MTLRPILPVFSVLLLGAPLLLAEVPVDEPVAVIESARSFTWTGAEGNSVFVRPQGLDELWRIDYTPEGAVQPPVSFATPAGFQVWHATGNQALLVSGSSLLEGFRVIRTSDGTTLGELKNLGWLYYEQQRLTERGISAHARFWNGSQYENRLIAYDKGASVPVLKSYPNAGSVMAATDEWFALFSTESQIGDKIITILRTSDLGEVRQVRIPWQAGASSTAAATGNLLYFKLKDRFQCLDITTGSMTDVVQIDPNTSTSYYNTVAVDSSGLWLYQSNTAELDLHSGSPAAGYHHSFRGKIHGGYSSYSANIQVVEGRCHVAGSTEIQIFDPSLSRPRLDRREFVPVRESDAIYPLEITLDRAPDREVSVRFRTSGGSATPGLDYDPIDQVLTFPAGTRSVTVPLQLKSDLIAESNETIAFEATAPDGIRLGSSNLGGLTIVASGMEHRAIALKDASGNTVQGQIQEVLKDVMLGVIFGDTRIHLWNRHTGAYLGVTELPYATSKTVETSAGLETVIQTYRQIEIIRIDPANGRTLARRSFEGPSWLIGMNPIGGGRVFISYRQDISSSLFARIYALDGPAEGTEFPLFGGVDPGSFSVISDGRRLVIGWDANMSWYTPPPGPSQHLRWYSADTLQVEHEMSVDFRPNLLAIRGNLLFCEGVRAIDLEKRQLAWENLEIRYAIIGNTHMTTSPNDWEGKYGVWETATGIKVEEGFQYDSRMPGDAPFKPHQPAYGTGGIIVGNIDYRADRQRPALEWLGTKLRPDQEQARIPLRTSERSDQTLSAGFKLLDGYNPSDFRQIRFPANPATVPGDDKIHLLDFHAPPEVIESATFPTVHGIEVNITAPGAVPLTRSISIGREQSTAPMPPHLVRKLPAVAALNLPRFQMRYADGRIVLATGTDYPDVDPNGQVHILDAATGNLLFSMNDPAPMYRRAFAVDAIVQGNKLLVMVRHVPTGVRTGEIYDITTRALLGTIADPGSDKISPSYLDSSATHFALGAVSLAWFDKKAAVAVYQWSDFKRVFQKTGRAGGGLGNGVDLKGNRFFAGILGSKAGDVGLVGQAVGTKLKMAKPPKGFGGRLITGEPLLYLNTRDGFTRAYDPATYREIWSMPDAIHGAIKGTERDFAWIDGTRDLSIRDGSTGQPLATSRFAVERTRIYSTQAVASPDWIFFGQGKELHSVLPSDLGDFADTRRWKNKPTVLASPTEDLDGNGQPDFEEYVLRRLPPGGSLGSARLENGQLVVVDGSTPPVDLVSVVEVEVAEGWWYPVAWRDGLMAWVKRALPAKVTDDTPLRIRHLPHPTLGWFPPQLSWPPLAVAIADNSASVIPVGSSALAATGSARASAVTSGPSDGQPLQLVHSNLGWGVEYLRPTGAADQAVAEFSHDLILWLPAEGESGLSTTTEPFAEGWEKVTIRPTGEQKNLFFRLRYPE